jgi:hypothetical protein
VNYGSSATAQFFCFLLWLDMIFFFLASVSFSVCPFSMCTVVPASRFPKERQRIDVRGCKITPFAVLWFAVIIDRTAFDQQANTIRVSGMSLFMLHLTSRPTTLVHLLCSSREFY